MFFKLPTTQNANLGQRRLFLGISKMVPGRRTVGRRMLQIEEEIAHFSLEEGGRVFGGNSGFLTLVGAQEESHSSKNCTVWIVKFFYVNLSC
jgi:hypothetical protein